MPVTSVALLPAGMSGMLAPHRETVSLLASSYW